MFIINAKKKNVAISCVQVIKLFKLSLFIIFFQYATNALDQATS